MKKLILLISLIALSKYNFSQDTIVMLTNQEIIAKITEINSNEVKYKRYDMQDGPDFTEKKSKIKMIKYRNGVVDNFLTEKTTSKNRNNSSASSDSNTQFTPLGKKKYTYNGHVIGENKMYKIMLQENDPALQSMVKKAKVAKGVQFAGFLAIPAAIVTVSALISSAIADNFSNSTGSAANTAVDFYQTEAVIGAVATIAFGTTGIIFSTRHTKLKAQAVKLYNQKF